MFKQKFTTRTLTTLAMLIAIEVILSRFLSINAWNIKIGFGFVPVVIAAILYGPLAGGIVGALSDSRLHPDKFSDGHDLRAFSV